MTGGCATVVNGRRCGHIRAIHNPGCFAQWLRDRCPCSGYTAPTGDDRVMPQSAHARAQMTREAAEDDMYRVTAGWEPSGLDEFHPDTTMWTEDE